MSHPFYPSMGDSRPWARKMFGDAELGDARNTRRLVKMAASIAKRPAGRVTQVFENAAEQQAAYNWLENDRVDGTDVLRTMGRALTRQCLDAGLRRVFIAGDGSSIRVTDTHDQKGTGRVGSAKAKGRGFEVMSGLAMDPHGTPIDLAWQRYWARTGKLKRESH